MAPSRTKEPKALSTSHTISVPGSAHIETNNDDPPPTATPESQDPSRVFRNLIDASKKRRNARREKNRAEYNQAMSMIEQAASAYFSDVTVKRSEAQKARVQKLSALMKKRFEIEQKMIKCGEEIEKAHEAARRDFEVAIKGRLSDLQEGIAGVIKQTP